MSTEVREIMTVKDVAQYLNVHRSTVEAQIKNGRLPAVKIGKLWRVRKSDIHRVFDEELGLD